MFWLSLRVKTALVSLQTSRQCSWHFADFLQAHGQCPGVFLVKQSAALADVIEDLIMVWAASDAEEWRNRIVEIPQ
jgi:hypothetical protein